MAGGLADGRQAKEGGIRALVRDFEDWTQGLISSTWGGDSRVEMPGVEVLEWGCLNTNGVPQESRLKGS